MLPGNLILTVAYGGRNGLGALARIGMKVWFVACAVALLLCVPPAWAAECPEGGSHEFQAEIVRFATADEDGVRVFTCEKCGYSYEDAIPKTGHDWGPWVREVEPTCTSEGLEYRLCQNATHVEHREERIVPMLSDTGEHNWHEQSRVDATCEEAGTVVLRCSVCADEMEQRIEPLGHDWGAWEPVMGVDGEPTGKERSVCARNSQHVKERTAPAAVEDVPQGGSVAALPVEAEEADVPPTDESGPNLLDRIIVVGDLLAALIFLVASFPLAKKAFWISARRKQAGAPGNLHDEYGRMSPDAWEGEGKGVSA